MTANSKLAKQLFFHELEAARKYDDEQYVYTVEQAYGGFKGGIATALFAGTLHKMEEISERLQSGREEGALEEVRLVSTQNGVKIIAIREDDGGELLYAWETGEKRTEIRIFATKPTLPDHLRFEIDNMIVGKDFDLLSLQAAKDIAAAYAIESDADYATAKSVDAVVKSINKNGLKGAKGAEIARGTCFQTRHGLSYKAYVPENSSMEKIGRIASVIGTEDTDLDSLGEEFYVELLAEGKVQENEDSLAALLLETLFERKMTMLKEIVAASDFLELDQYTYASHGDGDREVYVQRTGSKDIYVHNNIDRFENVYLLSLNGEHGNYSSVDILISKPWYSTLHSHEIYDDEPMTWDTLHSFISYQDENGGTIRDVQVIEALMQGDRPGLVGSFDLKTGEFIRGPFFENTKIMPYLHHMIDMDHNALTNAIKGELEEVGTFDIKTRDQGSEELGDETEIAMDTWLDKIGKGSALSI